VGFDEVRILRLFGHQIDRAACGWNAQPMEPGTAPLVDPSTLFGL